MLTKFKEVEYKIDSVSDEIILWNARLLDSLPGGESALLSDEFLRGTNLSIFHAERYHGPGAHN